MNRFGAVETVRGASIKELVDQAGAQFRKRTMNPAECQRMRQDVKKENQHGFDR
jgi:hypothetical protein